MDDIRMDDPRTDDAQRINAWNLTALGALRTAIAAAGPGRCAELARALEAIAEDCSADAQYEVIDARTLCRIYEQRLALIAMTARTALRRAADDPCV